MADGVPVDSPVADCQSGVAHVNPSYLTSKDHFHDIVKAFKDKQKCTGKNSEGGIAGEKADNTGDKPEPPEKRPRLGDDDYCSAGEGGPDAGKSHQQQDDVTVAATLSYADIDSSAPSRPTSTTAVHETSMAKKRVRGQNKNRPHVKPNSYEVKLCPSVLQGSTAKCFYGDRCYFIHDVAEYMLVKPPDLGPECHLYQTFGRCPYGITCRYASGHPEIAGGALEEKTPAREITFVPLPGTVNHLQKGTQKLLRKRQFPFTGAETYLRSMSKQKGNSKQKPTPKSEASEDPSSTSMKHGDSKSESSTQPAELISNNCPTTSSVPIEKECFLESNGSTLCSDLEKGVGKLTDCLKMVSAGDLNNHGQAAASECAASKTSEPRGSSISGCPVRTSGVLTDEDIIKIRQPEKKTIDFRDKLYLAPLTTLEGGFPDTMTKCAELLNQNVDMDFVDINVGCPIDLVINKGGGCALMNRALKFEQIVRGMVSVLDVPLTAKIRTGVQDKTNTAHKLIPELRDWGISMVTLHGRSREQRYTKLADWKYIDYCAEVASPLPLFGNGDVLSYEDMDLARQTKVAGVMIARGALIKPWIFTEIKGRRHWDISSHERFELLRDFTKYGLEHWGSDTQGVEKTRKFLLEWLSFLCRYIPVGILERVPLKINERPPYYLGRDDMESLMASQNVADWITISEMLLGPVPSSFTFLPKHKANAYK
ncbi:tRNA-dihydrouridine(47) synthase [NAD(P)(+)]-like isoform X2 [Lethenteron reissneri]|uniref:tRNA-dihydrouridine(47) synthase [NAD(P)(+)]-like isoform X2 n=1 Tax=Lethenteron reissneri TaxID=7753 RepID=UPI002AB5E299|nr:tRNA-dihydrouridine(47) synthase [NAD(P)(+)]-like isoform X2 [Lethenteron reissneri]